MSKIKQFPFEKARRITDEEREMYRQAYKNTFGRDMPKRSGRPPKAVSEKYQPISLRLHPKVLAWLKREAKKSGVPYQTIINQLLTKAAGKALTERRA